MMFYLKYIILNDIIVNKSDMVSSYFKKQFVQEIIINCALTFLFP